MPTITATPVPTAGLIQVDVDWRDRPSVEFVRVERVNTLTGAVFTLRPHTAILAELGSYIRLSDGRARLFDTEAPLDVPVYYRTASSAEPDSAMISGVADLFDRTVANGLGVATTGQTYTLTGTAADFDVASDQATIALTAVNSERRAEMVGPSIRDVDVQATFQVDKLPLTQPTNFYLYARIAGTDYVRLLVTMWHTSNDFQLRFEKVAGGVGPTAVGLLTDVIQESTGTELPLTINTSYSVRMRLVGGIWQAKMWLTSDPEPAGWTIEEIDTTVDQAGTVGFRGILLTGSTVALPLTIDLLDFSAAELDASVDGPTVTLVSGDDFWLRNPMRPCDDRRVVLCPPKGCPTPDPGIIYVGMPTRNREANSSTTAPVNRKLGISASRPRRGISSTMTLALRSWTDHEDLDALLDDGRPLLFSAPPVWHLPDDLYMDIGASGVTHGLPDQRRPEAIVSLPFNQVEPPSGPAKAPCGASYTDACASPATDTWAEANAAGLTYNDMIDTVP